MTIDDLFESSKKGLSWYSEQLKNNASTILPALGAAAIGTWGGQEALEYFNESREVVVQSTGYLSGLVVGYSVFLEREYKQNPEKYPNGFFSKDMLKTLGNFASADYVGDLVGFTPQFVFTNHYLLEQGMDQGMSGLIAAGVASTSYYFAISALYGWTEQVSAAINKNIKKVFKA